MTDGRALAEQRVDGTAVAGRIRMAARGPRLVCVSARAPFVTDGSGTARAPGGVISALIPLLRKTRGSWIATGGDAAAPQGVTSLFDVVPVSVPASVRARWYAGACNGGLWPLAHGFLDKCRFRREDFRAYQEVNRLVAEAVIRTAAPDATVWVHDYQLALVPALCREQRPDLTIGFFWHIPWPSSECLHALPWAEELLQGILGADVVGVHVPRYQRAMEQALLEGGIPHWKRDGELVVDMGRRLSRVAVCPIGVDAIELSALATSPEVEREATSLRRSLGSQRILLAVDRLDYSKGVLERLEAYERALESSEELRRSATLIQIGVPSRESVDAYRELRQRIERAVGRIQGRFGTATRSPIRFVASSLPSRELAPFYVAADAALVTPMRDGMNLVAMEYIATRPSTHGAGRLLLSCTAGAADILPEAHIVNPYDEDAMVDRIIWAGTAPETAVDATRMEALKARVMNGRVDVWIDRFLRRLAERHTLQMVAGAR